MASPYGNSFSKPQSQMQALIARLQLRVPSYFFSQGVDANGFPAVLVSSTAGASTGQNNALISITPVITSFTNLLGGTEDFQAGPLIANVCYENSSTTGVPVVSGTFNAAVQIELARTGDLQALYLVNNGTTLSLASINAQITTSTQVQEVLPDLTTGQLFGS